MFRFILCFVLVGVARRVAAAPLTFAGALQIATRSSPDLAQQGANVEAARSASIAAGRLPDPKLAFGVEDLPVTGPNQWSLTRDDFTMTRVGLMQDIPNGAKREAQSAAASAALETAQAQRRVSVLTVRRDTGGFPSRRCVPGPRGSRSGPQANGLSVPGAGRKRSLPLGW
ncbi:MAG TPA: TolC family protein [Steroidobacteraceae bacterium]|nr:TolC family protein [Steroidobacteraceae bacterium]